MFHILVHDPMPFCAMSIRIILREQKQFEHWQGEASNIYTMKFGFRKPSLNKRIAARTSLKRIVRHNLGFKAPRGMGWLTNPRKAAYNRIYSRTTRGCLVALIGLLSFPFFLLFLLLM
jgi:hypothetical protein